MERTDQALVEASLRGERAAFGHLVARYQDVVCAVSYSSTGDRSLSEDVAQDTFIAAWRQLGQLRETRTLRSWLCGIARNLARKARRRGGRTETLDDEPPAIDANPFEVTAQAEVDRVVREALARVPDAYREVLVLYYRDGRSLADVAKSLGISEANAQQRVSRGRRYLAAGVNAIVERSLRGSKRDLVPGVMAVVARLPVPSRVDPPLTASKGSTMFVKAAIAAVVLAAAGTTVYTVQSHDRADETPRAQAASAPVVQANPTLHAAASAPSLVAQKPATHNNAPVLEDAPVVLDQATIQRTKLYQGPSRGPANAKVDIVVFQDAMCKYCGIALGTIDQLFDEYPGQLRLVVKQLPVHDAAKLAAEASYAADAQGKFWEMHDMMFQHEEDLSRDALIADATRIGLDVAAFTDALDHHTYAPSVAADEQAAKDIGIQATPGFVIAGTELMGARDISEYRTLIDQALGK